MKNILKAVVLLAAITSISAHAAIYNFSYKFDDDSMITGSLAGNLNGSYIDNIADVHVFLNDTEFSGATLFHTAWNTTTHDWDNTISAKVSPFAALNNFLFADSDVPTDYNLSNYFYYVNDPFSEGVFANNLNNGDIAFDSPQNASWSLTEVPAVIPEPASFALMFAGLAVLGMTRRRPK